MLVNGGDLSVLAPNCSDVPEGHSFESPVKGYCIYYHRDRGEDLRINVGFDLRMVRNSSFEYNYEWDGERWIMLSF
jgi:hypothetical protein